jgi:hypothetical protein
MKIMLRIYRLLMFLYPARYRAEFGQEMPAVMEQALRASDHRGRFFLSEIAGLIAGAIRERMIRRPPMNPASHGTGLPEEVLKARLRVDDLVGEMVCAIAAHQFENARRLSNEERIERDNLRRLCGLYGIDAI